MRLPADRAASSSVPATSLELHVHRPDLQDVFFRVTGRALRD